jgi:hypothetical protein
MMRRLIRFIDRYKEIFRQSSDFTGAFRSPGQRGDGLMKYDVVINGYVSLDRIIKTTTPLRYGYTSLVENSDNARIQYGGCSTNIAYLMASLYEVASCYKSRRR